VFCFSKSCINENGGKEVLNTCATDCGGQSQLGLTHQFRLSKKQYGGPYLPRQNLLFHGKTYFSTAKLTFPRQNLLFHAKLTFSRQNLLFHGKTYFFAAKLTFSRQNLLFHGKTYFSTAKLYKGTGREYVNRKQDGGGV